MFSNYKMKMHQVFKTVSILLILTAFIESNCAFAQKVEKGKPNIIFILTDDLGWGDVGVFYQNQRAKANDKGEPWMFTPNLDKLAEQGAQLPHHYCAAPVCAPSRASLLLGVSQGHANVRDNQFDKALEDNYTMPSVLREAGYVTAAFGKWGLQGGNQNGTTWPAHPLNRGFDYFLGYMRHRDGHEHYPKEGLYRGTKQVWENRVNIAGGLDKCYTADLWTAAMKKWIIDHKKEKGDVPFFAYLAYDTPHAVLELPTQAYPAGGGIKGGLQWLDKPGRMINTASGKVDSWVHPDYLNATYDDDHDPATREVPWPDTYKRYATSVRRIDSSVGDIMALLKDLNIDSNTLVVFTSDNGPSLESYLPENQVKNNPDFFNSFGPFDGVKRDCWEGGVRMPTIARWPARIPAKHIVENPSASYDWLPTFTDAAGVPAPARTDGVSLLPSLTGVGKQRESLVYVEYFNNGVTPGFAEFDPGHHNRKRNQMQMIRIGDHAGVRYNVQSHGDDFEIYNVVKDPGQRDDLAKDAKMDGLQKRMKEKILQVRRQDPSAPRPYDDELVPAVHNSKTKGGVTWKAYNGSFPWVPEVATLAPVAAGEAERPEATAFRPDNQGLLFFHGYLRIPEDGEYTFYLSTHAGALLRIHEATVIDADYSYASGIDGKGKILLKAGLHPFRLYCISETEKKPLVNLQWQGPGITRQQIPAGIFCHD
jgi:arylsulfatase A-like enzyme